MSPVPKLPSLSFQGPRRIQSACLLQSIAILIALAFRVFNCAGLTGLSIRYSFCPHGVRNRPVLARFRNWQSSPSLSASFNI